MTGLVVGLVVGLLTGFGIEVVLKKTMIVMTLGGAAGVLLGTAFEAIRFWWRMRGFRKAKNTNK